jgi:hypothetical protein
VTPAASASETFSHRGEWKSKISPVASRYGMPAASGSARNILARDLPVAAPLPHHRLAILIRDADLPVLAALDQLFGHRRRRSRKECGVLGQE